jgi:hypothetical protein
MASFDFMYLVPRDQFQAMQTDTEGCNVEVNNVINNAPPPTYGSTQSAQYNQSNQNKIKNVGNRAPRPPSTKVSKIGRRGKKEGFSFNPTVRNTQARDLPPPQITDNSPKQQKPQDISKEIEQDEEEPMDIDEPMSEKEDDVNEDVEMVDVAGEDVRPKNKKNKKKNEEEKNLPATNVADLRQSMDEVQQEAMADIVQERLDTLQGKKKKTKNSSKKIQIDKDRRVKYKTLHNRLLHDALHTNPYRPSKPLKREREEEEGDQTNSPSKKSRHRPPPPSTSVAKKRRRGVELAEEDDKTKRMNLRVPQRTLQKRRAPDSTDDEFSTKRMNLRVPQRMLQKRRSSEIDYDYDTTSKRRNLRQIIPESNPHLKRKRQEVTHSEDEEESLIPRKVSVVRAPREETETNPEFIPLPEDYFDSDNSGDE